MPKSDSKVHHSSNVPSSTCRWKAFHQFVLGRKLSKPAVLSATNFPDAGEICMCQSRLYLRSSEVGEKDISRALCELLGLELNVYLFIELDGFSRKGGLRLVSLLTSLLKLFDQRLTVLFVSETKVDFKLVEELIEKEYKYDQISNKKVCKSEEEVYKKSKSDEFNFSHKESLQIADLKNQVSSLEIKSGEDQASFKLAIDELNEKVCNLTSENKDLLKSSADKIEAVKRFELQNKEVEAEVKELRIKNRESSDSANEHLEERNLRLKQLEGEEEKVAHLRNVLNDKDSKIEELEKFSTELKVQITGNKYVADELKKEKAKNEELYHAKKNLEELLVKAAEESALKSQDLEEKHKKMLSLESAVQRLEGRVDEQERLAEQGRLAEQARLAAQERLDEQGRLAEQEKLAEQERLAEQGRLTEQERLTEDGRLADKDMLVEQDKAVNMNEENKAAVEIIQEKILRSRGLFPLAGSSEIVHRSISSLRCDIKYSAVASGLCECTVSVVRGAVAQISSLNTFKGKGTSKQKSKQNAFDDYLSLLLNH